jgi:peptidoglycan/LPS O-acetylase OafA/YrhL
MLVGFILMLPNEFVELGSSVTAASLFVSNIFFWNTAGYFDGPAELQPLLHTWSLAVEEQFYIFFPIFLWLIYRSKKQNYVFYVSVVALVSFILCIWSINDYPASAFYLLPTRVWELAMGSIVAMGVLPTISNIRLRSFTALSGLSLIVFGLISLSSKSVFPGINALYPCIGAAILIGYAQRTAVGNFLSISPLVAIGKISYSLYLWHWPVIVFYRLYYGFELNVSSIITVIFLSFFLATLSYFAVEKPFRRYTFRVLAPKPIIIGSIFSISVFTILGTLISSVGHQWRDYPAQVVKISAYSKYDYHEQFSVGKCLVGTQYKFSDFNKQDCLKLSETKKNYLILGDSHAAQITPALSQEFKSINFLQATASACLPNETPTGRPGCVDLMNFVFSDFINNTQLDGIILIARWSEHPYHLLPATVRFLGEVTDNIIVFGPTVEYKGVLPILLAQARWYGNPEIPSRSIDPRIKQVSDDIKNSLSNINVNFIPILDIVCPNGICVETTPLGIPIQFDYGHLTDQGALWITKIISRDYWQ